MRIRKWTYTTLLLIGFAALVPGFLRSQQDGAISFDEEELPEFRIGVDVGMVSVPVTVRRADGSFFRGLTQKSFRILEDGKEQEIVFFAQEALPTHIAIVLDISGSVRPEWGSIKQATKRFIEHFRPDDSFSITTFNTEVVLKMPWGKRTDRVDAVLTSIYCKDETKLWDAIWVVATEVFEGIDGKKVMIVMTDGLDNQSISSYADAVRASVENQIAIYIVSKVEALRQYFEYLYPGGVPQGYFAQAESILRRLADDTGGRVLRPNNFGQLGDVYDEVSEELRNQYTLGYISTNTAKDGTYREINVGVSTQDARNVTITSRPGYYAPRR